MDINNLNNNDYKILAYLLLTLGLCAFFFSMFLPVDIDISILSGKQNGFGIFILSIVMSVLSIGTVVSLISPNVLIFVICTIATLYSLIFSILFLTPKFLDNLDKYTLNFKKISLLNLFGIPFLSIFLLFWKVKMDKLFVFQDNSGFIFYIFSMVMLNIGIIFGVKSANSDFFDR